MASFAAKIVCIGFEVATVSRLDEVKKVLVILAAPRSGSSVVYHAVTQVRNLYSLQGESTLFFKKHFPKDSVPQDERLSADQRDHFLQCVEFKDDLADFLVSHPVKDFASLSLQEQRNHVKRFYGRLQAQWPLKNWSRSRINELFERNQMDPSGHIAFHKNILKVYLNEKELCYYDDLKVRSCFVQGPPSEVFFEEPLFVYQPFAPSVSRDQLSRDTLVLKSSGNSYRWDFLTKLFPHAEFQWVHLTRNPLASMNGLMDGWLHQGFFSYNVFRDHGVELDIKGYKEQGPWASHWWNFDLTPGWKDWIHWSLEKVVLEQWKRSNLSVLNSSLPLYPIKFEEFLKSPKAVLNSLSQEFKWEATTFGLLPIVQSTSSPFSQRWKMREPCLSEVFLSDTEAIEIAERLGYNSKQWESWP
ncbi:MAG: hypothetical protein KDD61_05010 [Bdellovibrionales bacterium]|nr:hypothetical protein [Bdellovibrionales bacterium]